MFFLSISARDLHSPYSILHKRRDLQSTMQDRYVNCFFGLSSYLTETTAYCTYREQSRRDIKKICTSSYEIFLILVQLQPIAECAHKLGVKLQTQNLIKILQVAVALLRVGGRTDGKTQPG